MKTFSIHEVQINTQQIHPISIQKKQPTMLKMTSIHFKNKILLNFLQILHTPNNRVPLYIFKELTPNTSSLGSKTEKKVLSHAPLTISPGLL